jgi:hypothetical protein
MLIAQSLNPTILPQFFRFPANLACAQGCALGGFDAWPNIFRCTIHAEAQAAGGCP